MCSAGTVRFIGRRRFIKTSFLRLAFTVLMVMVAKPSSLLSWQARSLLFYSV